MSYLQDRPVEFHSIPVITDHENTRSPKIVTIANQKGGVGKTTTAYNLAVRLTEKGKTVLICDLDGQGNMSVDVLGGQENAVKYLSKKPDYYNSCDLYEKDTNVNGVEYCTTNQYENLYLIPANKTKLDSFNLEHSSDDKVFEASKHLLIKLMQFDVDYIFLDTPPASGGIQKSILFSCDMIFFVLHPDAKGHQGVHTLINSDLEDTNKLRSHLNLTKTQIGGVFLNNFSRPAFRKSDRQAWSDNYNTIKRKFDKYLLHKSIPESKLLAEAGIECRAPWNDAPTGHAKKIGNQVRNFMDLLIHKLEQL